MKSKITLFLLAAIASFQFSFSQNTLTGAWRFENGTDKVLIINPGYFSVTEYNGKQFISAWGGKYNLNNNELNATVEFHTANKEAVGKQLSFSINSDGNTLTTDLTGEPSQWQRLDDGNGSLAGTWRITGREQNGTMNTMNRGARKTIKLLSATRFQWAAINTETGEFFGTGGGTYSYENGTYTENIKFFSRDSSKVGKSLSFKGTVQGNDWHHSGKSSAGDPIYEIWSREM